MAAPTMSRQNSAQRPLRKKGKDLPFPLNLYQTAVGKKWVMAVTGIMLLGFVVSHMFDEKLAWAAGAVYVYEPDGTGGYAETKLTASDGALQQQFGNSVAVFDDTVMIPSSWLCQSDSRPCG